MTGIRSSSLANREIQTSKIALCMIIIIGNRYLVCPLEKLLDTHVREVTEAIGNWVGMTY